MTMLAPELRLRAPSPPSELDVGPEQLRRTVARSGGHQDIAARATAGR
ncbi:MAG: hypothetical protein M3527_09335 [Actinomycetota bacterium]|nr:hypothetical protein [Acidimicrobiia bacterium]MDQ3294634.1 hypothetical protein [Actinomycetota bacterium]